MNDFGGSGSGGQIGQYRNLLPVFALKQDGANQSYLLHARFLFHQPVGMPFSFERKPTGLEALGRVPPARLPTFQIGDEADLLRLQKTESISAIPTPVENQRKRLVAVHFADLGHGG